MVDPLFLQVAAVLAVAAAAGSLALFLRQPLVVAFLAAGVLVGPAGFSIVQDEEPFELLARLGIVLLLFAVGLKLDPRTIRDLGFVSLVTGTVQVAVTAALGFGLAHLLGFSLLPAVYAGVAFSFSSTIVIVKLLADKRESETLHGRLATGLLIVQDIWVVIVLVVFSLLQVGSVGEEAGAENLAGEVALVLLAGCILIGGGYLVTRYVFPRLLDRLAESRELLVAFAVAWGIGVAGAAEWAGLSAELGGFVAGVTLAASTYREVLGARLVSLRDFLLIFFFVVLGAALDPALIRGLIVPVVVFSLFVFVVKPVLVLVVLAFAGFRLRTSFLSASMMGQTSEFGLILAALGLSLGHLAPPGLGLITLVSLVTIAASTYVILHNRAILERVGPALGAFEHLASRRGRADADHIGVPVDVLVFGVGRFGRALAEGFRQARFRVRVVDLDPRAVARSRRAGLDAVYGDAADPEFPRQLHLSGLRLVVSTVPHAGTNRILVKSMQAGGFSGKIVLTAHTDRDAERLEGDGFRVLLPFRDAAAQIVDRLLDGLGAPNEDERAAPEQA